MMFSPLLIHQYISEGNVFLIELLASDFMVFNINCDTLFYILKCLWLTGCILYIAWVSTWLLDAKSAILFLPFLFVLMLYTYLSCSECKWLLTEIPFLVSVVITSRQNMRAKTERNTDMDHFISQNENQIYRSHSVKVIIIILFL